MTDGTQTGAGEARGASGASVVSELPGRLRLRVDRSGRSATAVRRLAEALEARPAVTAVRWSELTGSVLVEHDPSSPGFDEVREALDGLGVALRRSAGGEPESAPTVAAQINRAGRDLDRAVARRTRELDLRTLVPLGLGAISLRQALRGGPRLADAPWYVMAWYAFESFQKLQGDDSNQAP